MSFKKTSLLVCLSLAALAAASGANAHGKFRTLYSFVNGEDGNAPESRPIVDADGNVYGATQLGPKNGTVFKIAPDGNLTLLATFDRGRGAQPAGSMWRDAKGNLFGTTRLNAKTMGAGTVYKITSAGRTNIVHTFSTHDAAGYFPPYGVIGDAQGNLYGTTVQGAARNGGALFKLTPNGKMSVLYAFAPVADGPGDPAGPMGTIALDANGNVYGTTETGGAAGGGTLYKIAPDGTASIIYSFGLDDGKVPLANGGVFIDASGNFYTTTYKGGAFGYGTIYKIAPDGTAALLHSFNGFPDGMNPNGPLVADAHGNLYGTTQYGGVDDRGGSGTVYEISPGGRFRVIHMFDGTWPRMRGGIVPGTGLAIDAAGNLYGTTQTGGGRPRHPSLGTVFKINAQ